MSTSPNSPQKLSRGEVETLSVLHAVGTRGCLVTELPGRLGLSSSLTLAVADGVQPLVLAGFLSRAEERVAVTPTGATHLATRLGELGIR